MARFALIPAAPILLENIDLLESARTAALRAEVEGVLSSREVWSLPVDTLPPLAGLGGLGIDRGIDTRTGQLLSGEDWVEAVRALSPEERAACESAHPGVAVALMHAHSAGVRLGPLGAADDLVVPLDLSVAASPDAPLAPAAGAAAFDDALVAALTAGEVPALLALTPGAASAHADIELLTAALAHLAERSQGSTPSLTLDRTVFDADVHDVRSLCATGSC